MEGRKDWDMKCILRDAALLLFREWKDRVQLALYCADAGRGDAVDDFMVSADSSGSGALRARQALVPVRLVDQTLSASALHIHTTFHTLAHLADDPSWPRRASSRCRRAVHEAGVLKDTVRVEDLKGEEMQQPSLTVLSRAG